MMNRALLALLMWCAVLAVVLPVHRAMAGTETIVTAAQVNGTWQNKNGTF